MSVWQTGTTTNYINLSVLLTNMLTGRSVTAVAVNAAGTGYTVNDVLTMVGGTFDFANTVEVLTVGGSGEVLTVAIRNAGSYTAIPTNPVSTTGGTGTGATFDLTFNTDNGWTIRRETQEAASATPNDPGNAYAVNDTITLATGFGEVEADILSAFNVDSLCLSLASLTPNNDGTGYVVGDVLSLAGGTSTITATMTVTSIGGGGSVTGVSVLNHGCYTVVPPSPNSVTGGTGTGATVNQTMTQTGVNAVSVTTAGRYGEFPTPNPIDTTGGAGSGAQLDVTFQRTTTQNRDVILEGDGAAADQIFVGIRTYQSGSAFNWELAGFNGFNAALTWANQPGISPGRNDLGEAGAYFPLNNASMTFWFNIDPSRFIVVARVGTTYVNLYLGFGNRFSTTSQFPYPLIAGGCASNPGRIFSDNQIGFSGLTDPIAHATAAANGPMMIRDAAGAWQNIRNGEDTGVGRSATTDLVVFPCGGIDVSAIPTEDRQTQGSFQWQDIIPNTGDPGTPAARLLQTPETPNPVSVLVPATVVQQSPNNILVELDNVFWVSAVNDASIKVAEDTVTDASGNIYRVFQNCNRTDVFAFFAIREGTV